MDAAFELLNSSVSAIINGAIDKHDANRFMDRLIKGRFNTIEESTTVRIPAEETTAWLITLNMWLAKLPAEKLKPHSTFPQELEQMFAESFGVSTRNVIRFKKWIRSKLVPYRDIGANFFFCKARKRFSDRL